MDKLELCRAVLDITNIPRLKDKIYLIDSLIEMFGNRKKLTFEDIINYFIDEVIFTEEKLPNIEQRYVYKNLSKNFPALYYSKELEEHAPLMFGNNDQVLRRFKRGTKVLDRTFSKVIYIAKTEEILGVISQTNYFTLYTKDGKETRTVHLDEKKHTQETIITDLNYSELEHRV